MEYLKQEYLTQAPVCRTFEHAVVIGGSMAGLLAARVLSEHFEHVTIVERDRIPNEPTPRKGVPQGQHGHILQLKGTAVLRELFPDLFPKMAQEGSALLDTSEIYQHYFGFWKAPLPIKAQAVYQSRPFLEEHVRKFVAARGTVRIIEDCHVTQLCVQDHR